MCAWDIDIIICSDVSQYHVNGLCVPLILLFIL